MPIGSLVGGAFKAADTTWTAGKSAIRNTLGVSVDTASAANYRTMDNFGDTQLVDTRLLAKFDSLSWIHGLPPMVNNIVDPPPIMSNAELNGNMQTFSPYVGRDYVDTVLQRGQFLVLVPFDLIPSIPSELARTIGAQLDRAWEVLTLDKIQNRIDISSYGFRSEIASVKYNRMCKALLLTIIMSLGLNPKTASSVAKRFLPDYLVAVLFDKANTGRPWDYFPQLDFAKEEQTMTNRGGGDPKADNTAWNKFFDKAEETKQAAAESLATKAKAGTDSLLSGVGNLLGYNRDTTIYGENAGAGEDALMHPDALNILKYITNIQDEEALTKKLPWSVFYCDGGIEPQFGINQDIQDSALAKSVVDIGAKLGKEILKNIEGAEEFMSELAYHHQGIMGNAAGYLVENTAIPKIIRGNMMDMQYTINIKQTAIGSDPWSLVRPLAMVAFLMPFVVSPNSSQSKNIVPEAALYCAAFSKGAINMARGAITSLMIKTDPVFRTTAGVPMDIEVSLTLQPLISVGTMPNWGTIWKNTPTEAQLLAAMYNPLGAIPVLATMAGANTVLTKFPMGFFEFIIKGSLTSFWNQLKGIKSWVGDTIYDWNAEDTARFGRVAGSTWMGR